METPEILMIVYVLGMAGGVALLLGAGALAVARWAWRTGRSQWVWVVLAYAAVNVLAGIENWLLGQR